MPQPLMASMPDNVDIDASWTIEFAAIDPTTGDDVAGVQISEASLEVVNVAGGNIEYGPWYLVQGPDEVQV